MAGAPVYKVYRDGKYVAACKHVEDAAMLVAGHDGATIRHGHTFIVFTEGVDGRAGESYDAVYDIVNERYARLR